MTEILKAIAAIVDLADKATRTPVIVRPTIVKTTKGVTIRKGHVRFI